MTFVSIVGTQVMAVLNPLLAWGRFVRKPVKVVLLHTHLEHSQLLAASIEKFLRKDEAKHYAGIMISGIELLPVSSSLTTDAHGESAPVIIGRIAEQNRNMVINIAGGLGFLLTASIRTLKISSIGLLYPESRCVHLITIRNGKALALPLPLPRPVDVLKLQGLEPKTVKSANNSYLSAVMGRYGISRPSLSLMNIAVGGCVFDLAWSYDNEMHFLIALIEPIRRKTMSKFQKRQIAAEMLRANRLITLVARGRSDFGELYHRKVAVVTNSDDVVERLSHEGGGKVTILDARSATFERTFKAFFRAGPMEVTTDTVSVESENCVTGVNTPHRGTLALLLGANPMSTLVALWSTPCRQALLFYTPENKEIVKIKDCLLSNKGLLPVEEVTFVPIDFIGTRILETVPPQERPFLLNTTPGTKVQKTFLEIWGMTHGADQFLTCRTMGSELLDQNGSHVASLTGPSALAYLMLTGQPGMDLRLDTAGLRRDTGIAHLADFTESLHRNHKMGPGLPGRVMHHDGWQFDPRDGVKGILVKSGAPANQICLSPADWFEDVVGYQLLQAGADEVEIGAKSMRVSKSGQLTEIDVVARFKGNYVVVSCKTGNQATLEDSAEQAISVARLFGGFCLPMVAFCRDESPIPPVVIGRELVPVIDLQTLFDLPALKGMIEAAFASRRKTQS